VIATALGACIYERHLVLPDDRDAIDRAVSSTPQELNAIVRALAQTRDALGDGVKRCLPTEQPNRLPSRRGIYAARELRRGHTIAAADLSILRPASSLRPGQASALIGTTIARDIAAGEALVPSDLPQGVPA
jgi:N,N'-diacetyllegionaminate synthase